jgi:hypothetical protein
MIANSKSIAEVSKKMKIASVILTELCIISTMVLAGTQFDPFDSYTAISWELEKAHLDNFAIALQQDPSLIGYIVVYAGQRACVGEARIRALRAKKYVVETHGIQASRIKWIDGGYRQELTVILQSAPRGAPELKASPTLKPTEVKIIKNCKSGSSTRRKRGS